MANPVAPSVRIDSSTLLGSGNYGEVWKAVDEASGAVIACKASRASLRLKRPLLRYEARVLQLLQGHSAIPKLLGYRHMEHFEFLGLELLGRELKEMPQPGHAISAWTVLRVGEQMLSALEHLYEHKIVHRDIKPANILISLAEPSRVVLIDFGIARHLSGDEISSAGEKLYDPFEDKRQIMGTPDWCSLNAYQGRSMRPCDDLECLGYVLFYLFFGDLPWRGEHRVKGKPESYMHSMTRIYATKQTFSRMLPFSSAPPPLNELLQLAQAFTAGDLRPCLRSLREKMRSHINELGVRGPLDWTPVPVPRDVPIIPLVPIALQEEPVVKQTWDLASLPANSYRRMTHQNMLAQEERDDTLTFIADEAAALDGQIPILGDICGWYNW